MYGYAFGFLSDAEGESSYGIKAGSIMYGEVGLLAHGYCMQAQGAMKNSNYSVFDPSKFQSVAKLPQCQSLLKRVYLACRTGLLTGA